MLDAVIVGAGVSGLTLAFKLRRQGKQVLVVEKSARVGGVIQTKSIDGFTVETGPNTVLSNQALVDLVRELELEDRLVTAKPAAKNRYIAELLCPPNTWELHPAPRSPIAAINTKLLSTSGKFRLLKEMAVSRKQPEDESVKDFIGFHFGDELVDRVVAPALSGIWAADISKLSARSALSSLWEMEAQSGSIIRSLAGRAFQKMSGKGRRFRREMVSFPNGLEELPETIAKKLGLDGLYLNAEVKAFERDDEGFRVFLRAANTAQEIRARNLVLTTDAAVTSRLLNPLSESTSALLREIPYAPLGVIHLGVRLNAIDAPIDGFGTLCMPDPRVSLLGVLYSSSIFPGRAPDGWALLTCYCGGAAKLGGSKVYQEETLAELIEQVLSLLTIREAPKVIFREEWQKAIPNYPLYHFKLQQEISKLSVEFPGLYFLANWNKGISVADRISEAQELSKNFR